MTAITVSLREVVQELEALLEDATLYLDLETGELYQLGDDEAAAVEDGREDDLPEWLEDDLPRIREIVADERRWLALPTRFDIHEWAIMDEYARGQEDADLSGELSRAIHGRGAFRVFKDAVYRRGIQEDWYRFRDEAIADIVADWLDVREVAYVRDLDPT